MARIFLCHANEDKPQVRDVYQRLKAEGFDPWLDEEDLLPGQLWDQEIRKALRSSDFILIFFSQNSVAKRGYVQREMKLALDTWEEVPEGQIHTIPIRLNACQIPERFKPFQWVDLFATGGLERLIRAIQAGVTQRQPPQGSHTASVPLQDLGKAQKLYEEIGHRLQPLPMLQEDVFTFTQLHTAKGAVHGKAEEHPRLGKFGEFAPLFPEFLGMSLFALLWELQQLLPDQAKARLQPALASAKALPAFFDRLVLLVPVGEEDSKWQMDRKYLQQYKDMVTGLALEPWHIPPSG